MPRSRSRKIKANRVDPLTGEITKKPNGTQAQPWDEGKAKLDPPVRELQRVKHKGIL